MPGSEGGAREDSAADRSRDVAIVDGANVAHNGEDDARLANIVAVCEKLREEGVDPVVVADAALRHRIDQPADFERMVDDGRIRQAPAGTDADYFILEFAREMDARIVSNDRFRGREQEYADVLERVVRFMIVNGEVVLERRTNRRS